MVADKSASPTRAAVAHHYDARAATYDESALHRGLTEAMAHRLDDRGEQHVLDVACGTGLMLRSLRQSRPTLRATGVDFSMEMLDVARSALPDAAFLRADVASLPLRNACVDMVTCVTALHLLPDVTAVVAECARVLRPGGRLVTATFVTMPGSARPQPFPRDHDSFRTADQVAGLLSGQGFNDHQHSHWEHSSGGACARMLICQATKAP